MSKLKSEKREIIKKLKKNHDFLDKLDILLEYNTTLKQYFTKDFFPKMDLTLNREKRIEKMVKHKIRKRGKSEKASNEIIKQTADLYIQEEMKKTGINTILIRKLRKIKNIDLQLLKKEPKTVAKKSKFVSKEKQYEHTCVKALGLRKGSKRYMECALKIMEMELELTKLNAEKEVALAQAETAMAKQQTAKVAELNAMANAKSQKFKKNVGNLLLGLLVLGEINSASQQANSFKKVFTCSSTGFATGTQYAVNCY